MNGCGSCKYLYVHKREGYADVNIIKYGFFNVFLHYPRVMLPRKHSEGM